MRFLSGRISQHHLHLYPVNDASVERRHGLVRTLTDEHRDEEEFEVYLHSIPSLIKPTSLSSI